MQLSTAINLPNRQVGAGGFGYGASLSLDFTSGNQTLDSRITFTRASTATRVNRSGVIESVAINTPRFDYDPVTLASLGLLIEEQRTNLVTYSEQADNAAWSKTSTTITANAIISPDGAQDADKVIPDNAVAFSGTSLRAATITKSATATQYTASIYAKIGEFNRILFQVRDSATSANNAVVVFNLSNGAIITAATASGTFTAASASAGTLVGNGWYRFNLTFTSGTETGLIYQVAARDSVATTGNGTSGIYIWGSQLEAGAFATSYIPTVASQVTRSADLALMTGTNFSSWFNATEGTMYASYVLVSDSANIGVFEVDGNTSSNVIQMRYSSSSFAQYTVSVGGVTQASQVPSGYSASGLYKRAIAYKLNSFNQAINGALPSTEDTSGTIPTVTQARIGNEAASNFINGYIRQIAYYQTRLTNAQLQSITA